MATNTGENFRRGSVKDRTQVHNDKIERWIKRDTDTGEFIGQKKDGDPYKGVAKEEDGRRRKD